MPPRPPSKPRTVVEEALETVVRVLLEHGLDYAITGSFAMNYYGYVRASMDVDIKIRMVADIEKRLDAVEADLARRGFAILDREAYRYRDAFDVELYRANNEIDRDAFERRRQVRLFKGSQEPYWIVAPEDLVVIKIREYSRTGVAKHVEDVKAIVVAQRATLDMEYVAKRLRKHDLMALWEEHVERE